VPLDIYKSLKALVLLPKSYFKCSDGSMSPETVRLLPTYNLLLNDESLEALRPPFNERS
jgi:hypothetical protein